MSDIDALVETVREALHFCADVHGDRTAQAVDALPALSELAALACQMDGSHARGFREGVREERMRAEAERGDAETRARGRLLELQACEGDRDRLRGFVERYDEWMLKVARALGWPHDDWQNRDPGHVALEHAERIVGQARAAEEAREALRILENSEDHRLKAAEAERDRLKAENSEYHDQAIRDYQQINRLKAALRAIKANAVSWHGVEEDDSGHVKALKVIAQWCDDALDPDPVTPKTDFRI